MSIDWYDPELYYFLSLLTGIAALLAVVYEFPSQKTCTPPSCRSCHEQVAEWIKITERLQSRQVVANESRMGAGTAASGERETALATGVS
jgi:hypothetical protein